jgi:hypothetical protein
MRFALYQEQPQSRKQELIKTGANLKSLMKMICSIVEYTQSVSQEEHLKHINIDRFPHNNYTHFESDPLGFVAASIYRTVHHFRYFTQQLRTAHALL